MGIKKGLFLVFLLTISTSALISQVNRTGAPVVRWFDAMETPGDIHNCCATMDRRGVMYFGSHGKGILTYDGVSWGLVHIPGGRRVNAMVSDHRGVIYVGIPNDFGLLQPNDRGELSYTSLAERLTDSLTNKETGEICSIAADSSTVYFTDGRRLYLYDIEEDKLSFIDIHGDLSKGNVRRMLSWEEGRLIIADNNEGLFELNHGLISRITGGDNVKRVEFRALLKYDTENVLIATSDSGIYLLNLRTGDLRADFLTPEMNSILKTGFVSDAVRLPGNRFAVGVAGGEGIYIFSNDGSLLQQISQETTGIPESTITAMYCDYLSNSHLWFCTMGYINRAYVSLPVNEFITNSSLGVIKEFNGNIYVSHDLGLYRSFVDHDDKMQFLKMEGFMNKVFDLIGVKTSDWAVLIAATTKGLSQIDPYEQVSVVLDQENVTAVKADTTRPDLLMVGSGDGSVRTMRYLKGAWRVVNITDSDAARGAVKTIEISAEGEWWILTSGPDNLYRMQCAPSDTTFVLYDENGGLTSDTLYNVVTVDNNLYVCTARGLYLYNPYNDLFEKDNKLVGEAFGDAAIYNILKTPEGDIVISGFDSHHFDALVTPTRQGHVVFRRQFDFLPDIATSDLEYIDNHVWIVKGRNIYVVDKSKLGYGYGSFSTFFTTITAGTKVVLKDGLFYNTSVNKIRIPTVTQPVGDMLRMRYSQNNISFNWTTTSYVSEEMTEYRHRLDGFDKEWSKWENRNFREFTNLPWGDYTFRLRAKTSTGLESEEAVFSFSIRKPFYVTSGAILFYLLLGILLVFILVRYITGRLRNSNILLEQLAQQKTAEVIRQRDAMEASVSYASYVQRVLLPSERILADHTPNYFILFKPRDVVSGDFYWMARKEERLFIVAADCTGHGIPGAFMSLLGISFLNEIINKPAYKNASHILNELRSLVIDSLKQKGESEERKDGMDMAILVFDFSKRTVEFSGAFNPCIKVRRMNAEEVDKWEKGEFDKSEGSMANGRYLLETVYASRMPIGVSSKMKQDFTQHEWAMDRDTSYYIFTDGYIDQFNGTTGRKFMKMNFKKLILEVQDYPMKKQMEIFDERLKSWMGSSQQVDDILVMGIKID
jgi:serine phosphatase RsbU (regulator of sigma subunit)/ligand-binding sensor domain-containing protein